MTVGQRVREKRREKLLTLKQLAEATGLSLTYLSDVERDRTQSSIKTLRRIAQALGVTVGDLMEGVEDLGGVTDGALPAGLRELRADEEWGGMLDEEWIRTLLRVDYRGQRPQTKQEWLEVFLALRRILGDSRR
jgi:transcriptional regulator with XRE-family HTH domain